MPSQIENYGIIGNLHTCALVNDVGSIDMFCAPYFDSPSIFCKSLDENGGFFRVQPDFSADAHTVKQRYLPGTNTLATRWLTNQCAVELMDLFVIPTHAMHQLQIPDYEDWMILRQVQVTRGTSVIEIDCIPAFNYARQTHTTQISDNFASFKTKPIDIELKNIPDGIKYEYCSNPKACNEIFVFMIIHTPGGEKRIRWEYFPVKDDQCGIQTSVHLNENEILWVCMTNRKQEFGHAELLQQYIETNNYWRRWISKLTYNGKWQENMDRSALVLKLLTFYPTGAIVAAPTFSFPEELGGERNWDYRYIWVRDSSFTMYALIRLGLLEEAKSCLKFFQHVCRYRKPDGGLYIMYTIHGCPFIPEQELNHLAGFCGSSPVRIGNGAWDHVQLDIYGELMDAIYLYNKFGVPISYDMWLVCCDLVNYVVKNYDSKDMSIWEVRGEQQHFLYSKVMCWVALDRALRLMEKRNLPCEDAPHWKAARDSLYREIMEKGYNKESNFFKQSYSSDALDASTMIMSLVFFCPATDPRVINTVSKILQPVEKGGLMRNRLILRYDTNITKDGLRGDEGAFLMTTFWTIETVIRIAEFQPEIVDKLVGWFEEVMQYMSPLGLFSEEISKDGLLLGNYPQAFSHLAFISCVYRLDQLLKSKPNFKLVEFDFQ
eukprot:NODE_176_length_14102_cov_0.889595.p1 type:complete len:660 gc:universal NODE_176_length_14102_cov_0.889595:4627-6606(+)